MLSRKYIVQLDGLRFFAVLMVMVAHWAQGHWTSPILKSIPFIHGVTLFFVLSGFLITRILLETRDKCNAASNGKTKALKNFYIRRFLRIFPIYYLLIFSLYLLDYKNTHELFPWLVTYTSNIFQSIHNVYVGDFNHFWSLAIEEQFYIFWPLLILYLRPSRTLIGIVITIIVSLTVKLLLFAFVGKWMATSYFTLSCMHALGLGALLAYLKLYKPKIAISLSRSVWLYVIVVLYMISLLLQYYLSIDWYNQIFDDFFFAIMATFLILKASENGFKGLAKRILENRFVVYSGRISYGLYVFHLFIPTLFNFVASRFGITISNKYVFFVVLYLITFIVAHLSWKFIESPINSLKNRFPYIKNS